HGNGESRQLHDGKRVGGGPVHRHVARDGGNAQDVQVGRPVQNGHGVVYAGVTVDNHLVHRGFPPAAPAPAPLACPGAGAAASSPAICTPPPPEPPAAPCPRWGSRVQPPQAPAASRARPPGGIGEPARAPETGTRTLPAAAGDGGGGRRPAARTHGETGF